MGGGGRVVGGGGNALSRNQLSAICSSGGGADRRGLRPASVLLRAWRCPSAALRWLGSRVPPISRVSTTPCYPFT